MSVSIYLDTRAVPVGKPAPIKVAIRRKGATSFINTEIKVPPECWDSKNLQVIKHPNAKRINLLVAQKKLAVDTAILRLMEGGELSSLNARQLRDRIQLLIDPDAMEKASAARLFRARYLRYMGLQSNKNTHWLYERTLKKLDAFDPKLGCKKFEDVTKDYIQNFENYCAKTEKKNSRNIHLRNIRAVFNDAIDAEITNYYPFRKYAIKPEATRKKALTVEQLRALIASPCEPYQRQYRDMFLLMFMLRGVNAGDLFLAKPSDILDGRFDYRRNKVGTLFSVKLEPEALEIINRYKGKRYLLNPMEAYSDYKDYLHHLNDALKEIGRPLGKRGKVEGPGIFPGLSSNWARHTWATIASKLDIPKEVISKSLGHSFGLSVTDIYIDFDNSKVDEANRHILDFILYGIDYRNNRDINKPSE